jgi:site-specific DNA recombinase
MPTASVMPDQDLLMLWINGKTATTRRQRRLTACAGLRFAFYGRVSTADYQDPVSSRRWQLDVATELICGRGHIVAEFFDIGYTRELPWAKRPQAAALLAALTDPHRGFDAIVVGEYARAFSGTQLRRLAPLLQQHRIQLWIPETDGPVDAQDATHQALLLMLGAQAKREVQRARFRTTMAMQAQTREQGRYLGGRPPYGYRLVDAGPHPNRAHAHWGRRLHRLEPDPHTAPHVTWIFQQRLAGHSVAGIARSLNDQAVPCPSAADRDRNPHRPGDAWRQRTVAAILANPRYTGRQVWNRQHSERQPAQDALPGVIPLRRLAAATQWAVSTKPSHPALVSDHDFIAAQAVTSRAQPADGAAHTYLLVGLLRCGDCGRSMESQWSHGNPCYRCRHGHTTAHLPGARSTRNLHLREDVTLARLRAELAHLTSLDPHVQQELMKIRQRNEPADLITFLHRYEVTITCHRTHLTLQADSADLTFRPSSPDSTAGSLCVPRQRAVKAKTC